MARYSKVNHYEHPRMLDHWRQKQVDKINSGLAFAFKDTCHAAANH